MLPGDIYAEGLELQFFHANDFEKEEPTTPPDESAVIIARNALRILMMGWRNDWREIVSWKIFNAVFINRDGELLRGMRLAFQQGFNHIYSQLRNCRLTTLQHNQAQLYISNCLSLLPFADINPYESISVPQWINIKNEWQLVDYKVVPIELTPTKGFKKLFIDDEDRVFAYGLEPINNQDAEPHLIFMGTTYPAGQGFTTQINTDLEGFETAGNKLYRSGRNKIAGWLDKQSKKTHVCGMSLGGSLSLLLAADQGNKLSRVDAHNPPGFYNGWRKSSFDRWDELSVRPQVFVQRQGNDPVSRFGVWKKEWNLLQITPPASKQGPNQFTDHALNYAGFAETKFIAVDTTIDNEERKQRNFWLYTLARSLVYYFGLIPYRYGLLPSLRYALAHKAQLVLTLGCILIFFLLPTIATGIVIPFLSVTALIFLNAVISGVICGFLLDRILGFLIDQYTGKKESDLSQFFVWLNNQSIPIKLVFGVTALSVAIFVVAAFFVPPLIPIATPTLFLLIAAIPLGLYLIHRASNIIKTILGFNEVKEPPCHDPALPRNKALNIYTNHLEETFRYKEIGDYYYAKRCLLKNKEFLPVSIETGREKFSGLSKQEVLSRCEDQEFSGTTIKVKASKAKIYDMKQTVQLISRLGFHRANELKAILKENQQAYSVGKRH